MSIIRSTRRRSDHAAPAVNQRGAHAAAFLMTVVALFFAGGLGLDSGRMFIVKSEMQNAADACALAAASALNGGANSLDIAEARGITAGTNNFMDFQKKQLDTTSFITNSTVTFSDTLDGTYVSKVSATPGTTRYAQCIVDGPGVGFFIFPIVNAIAPGTVGQKVIGARAVATLDPSTSACVLPLGICTNGSSTAPWGFTVGEWLAGRSTAGDGWTGSYKWLSLSDDYDTVPEMAALISGTGACALPTLVPGTSTIATKTGQIQSFEDDWNTRFGVWKGGPGSYSGTPDFTGAGYTDTETAGGGTVTWPSGSNAFGDFKAKRVANMPWEGGSWPESPDISGSPRSLTAGQLGTLGGDRRVVATPVVDCPVGGTGAGGSYTFRGFACMLMLHPMGTPPSGGGGSCGTSAGGAGACMKLEFLGNADDPDPAMNPCIGGGLPGGSTGPKVPGLVK